MGNVVFNRNTVPGVLKLLPKTTPGRDRIPAVLYRTLAVPLLKSLMIMFQQPLVQCKVPIVNGNYHM